MASSIDEAAKNADMEESTSLAHWHRKLRATTVELLIEGESTAAHLLANNLPRNLSRSRKQRRSIAQKK
jgi:hypothetical protein